ncbi:MAG: single-stranded-DNA-specific exonuclease RecJ [Pseudomonadales bacterium]|nr:single-stranded-DNA-specific exonuclease RecJ [Pseudomonadales bacterium]
MKWLLKNTKIPSNLADLRKIILDNRSIDDRDENFFEPIYPLEISLKNVEIDEKQIKSVLKRIKKAKKNNQYIVIFGDYDADGICATAILWQTLYDFGCNVKPFIPNRKKHGYGISIKAIDDIILDKKPDLVISVDNGIVAHKPVAYLRNQNIDVIITDHHQPEFELGKPIFPNANYIIHSTKLCGATVSWMLAREINPNLSKELLDLCGIATIADQVKLTGANRSFAKFGIEAIKNSQRIGLKLLLKNTIKDVNQINSDSIGYIIAPRINAMGRMAEGIVALRFLCTKSSSQATRLLSVLLDTNDQRKNLTYELLDDAKNQIEKIRTEHILIVHSENYHEGILGLIAGSMLEKFNKPSIAINIDGKFAKASARSVPGVNIVDLLRIIKDDLIEVGGHPMAAGFGFESKKLETIKSKLFKLAKETIFKESLEKCIEAECILSKNLLTEETIQMIDKFEPFGQGNRKPMFEIKDLVIKNIFQMGDDNNHLRLVLIFSGKDKMSSDVLKAVGWKMGNLMDKFNVGDRISIIGSLELNIWNGTRSVQTSLKDIKNYVIST